MRTTNKTTRWLPAIIAPVVIAAGAVAIPAVADAASTPSAKTPQQVLQLIAASDDAHYSGRIAQSSDLGLPQLPATGSGSGAGSDDASSVLEFLTGSHTARIYVDGDDKARVQVLDSLAERDVVRNGADVWTYDSKQNAATHLTLPASSSSAPTLDATTPADAANRIVDAIDGSTTLAVGTGTVASRSVYTLTLTPKTADTLVAKAVVSVDSATGVPLKAEIDARGQKAPAFSVGFSSVDFSTPAASLFDFTAPKGAKVTEKSVPSHPSAGRYAGPVPTTTGAGWSTIVQLPAGTASALLGGSSSSGSQSQLFTELTTPVAGGRALQTSLVSVLITDDGRVFAGAVPVSALQTAAG